MNNIAANPAVVAVTIDGIRDDMLAIMDMNDAQREFFDYMTGRVRTRPSTPFADQLAVANCLMDVIDGFPIAHSFDQMLFPGLSIARNVRRQQARFTRETPRVTPPHRTPPVSNRSHRKATRRQSPSSTW